MKYGESLAVTMRASQRISTSTAKIRAVETARGQNRIKFKVYSYFLFSFGRIELTNRIENYSFPPGWWWSTINYRGARTVCPIDFGNHCSWCILYTRTTASRIPSNPAEHLHFIRFTYYICMYVLLWPVAPFENTERPYPVFRAAHIIVHSVLLLYTPLIMSHFTVTARVLIKLLRPV